VVGCHRYVSKVRSSCSNIISLFRRTTCLYLLSTVQPAAARPAAAATRHVCVRAASFPCKFLDLGLNFLLASAYCTRAHTLSLDSFCRPTAGNSSIPAGLSPLVYAYVVDCAPASPYAYSSSTHRFHDERTTSLGSSYLIAHVIDCPPPPTRTAL